MRLLTGSVVLPLACALRGQKLSKVRAELERSQWLSPGELRDLQWRKLQRILASARRTAFYRKRLAAAGLDRIESLEDFGRLPPLEKGDVRDLAAELAAAAARRRDVGMRRTAGTSGVPLQIFADGAADAHALAARMRSLSWYGVRPGDRELRCWGRPLPSGRLKARLRAALLNREVVHPHELAGPDRGALLDRVGSAGAAYAYGYSTMLSDLADAGADLGRNPAGWGLRAVVCTAESCRPAERRRLSRLYGCPVPAEYGCSEVDIVSFECPEGGHHVMAENVLLEVLPAGTDGAGEVLVTDLNNAFMPLLRYRLADIVALDEGACPCGRGLPRIGEVQGRHRDQYLTTPSGRRIHSAIFPYLIESLLDDGVDVRRYLAIQDDPGRVQVLVVLGAGADEELRRRVEDEIVRGTAGDLAGEVECRVEFVDAIPAEAGEKFTCFVPWRGDRPGEGDA